MINKINSLKAENTAKEVIDNYENISFPIDVFKIAKDSNIEIKSANLSGFSGAFSKNGEIFAILYSDRIKNTGFQRFTIAHELGHYFLEGHGLELIKTENIHKSISGQFSKENRIEMEADFFAANLLMPPHLFQKSINQTDKIGIEAIKYLANLCDTSIESTSIQYSKYTPEYCCIIIHDTKKVIYSFLSENLKNLDGISWIKKGDIIPKDSISGRKDEDSDETQFNNWFDSNKTYNADLLEDVLPLYENKTLTVLTVKNVDDIFEE